MEYEAARAELLEEIARGGSIEDLRAKLLNKTDKNQIQVPPICETNSKIPDDLVQIQAYIRWEAAGKPNYSPDEQLVNLHIHESYHLILHFFLNLSFIFFVSMNSNNQWLITKLLCNS